MSYIGNTPGVSSQRVVLEEVITGSPKSAFVPISGYIKGYVDVLINGVEIDTADFTAADGVTVTLGTAAAVGDTVKIKTWLPRGLSDGYLKSEADARFLQYYNGKAGVGTTTPQKLFVVSNGGANGIEISPDDASTSGLNRMLSYNRTSGAYTPMVFQGSEYRIYTKGTSADESVRVDNNGNVNLYQGNLVLASGKGIDFSANANAGGMTGEVFDDYETGTWTPIMITDGGGHSVTHTVQRGVYTKVGRVVTVSWYVAWSAFTGGSAGVRISNLPFLSQNSGPGVYYTGANAEHSSSITYPASMTTLTYEMAQNATTLLPVLNGSGAGTVGLTRSYVGTGSGYFIGSVTYDAA